MHTLKELERLAGLHYSVSKDRKRKALHPGKRTSRTGKSYYEYRRNRSDKDRRKRL